MGFQIGHFDDGRREWFGHVGYGSENCFRKTEIEYSNVIEDIEDGNKV